MTIVMAAAIPACVRNFGVPIVFSRRLSAWMRPRFQPESPSVERDRPKPMCRAFANTDPTPSKNPRPFPQLGMRSRIGYPVAVIQPSMI